MAKKKIGRGIKKVSDTRLKNAFKKGLGAYQASKILGIRWSAIRKRWNKMGY